MNETKKHKIKSRDEAIAMMPEYLTPAIMEDISYRIESHIAEAEQYPDDEPYTFDLWDAFRDFYDSAQSWAKEEKGAKAELLICNRLLIAVGCWTPISDDDARERVRCGSGVSMRHYPKIAGHRYEWDMWPV